jgi:pimeloyl-ACP methyl ester carboxylesterase
MPVARVNGIAVNYDDHGAGEPVVMVTGTGAPGRIWRTYQVPALRSAGYRVITMDNRGIAPTEAGTAPFTLADMADDVAALIDHLGVGRCRIVGFSLGALIVQQLLVSRSDVISQAVLMATRGRTDELAAACSAAEIELADAGIKLPPRYAATIAAMQNLSPRTLDDAERLRDWLDVLEMSPVDRGTFRVQLGLDAIGDLRPSYRAIRCPCLVIGFGDDLIARPHLSKEVAEAIPGAIYHEIADCGHYGYLERPSEVNAVIIDFFAHSPKDRPTVRK